MRCRSTFACRRFAPVPFGSLSEVSGRRSFSWPFSENEPTQLQVSGTLMVNALMLSCQATFVSVLAPSILTDSCETYRGSERGYSLVKMRTPTSPGWRMRDDTVELASC